MLPAMVSLTEFSRTQYMDADQVLEPYDGVDFASAGPLLGHAFSHAFPHDELAVGNVINSFKTATFGNTHPMSLEGLHELTDCAVCHCS